MRNSSRPKGPMYSGANTSPEKSKQSNTNSSSNNRWYWIVWVLKITVQVDRNQPVIDNRSVIRKQSAFSWFGSVYNCPVFLRWRYTRLLVERAEGGEARIGRTAAVAQPHINLAVVGRPNSDRIFSVSIRLQWISALTDRLIHWIGFYSWNHLLGYKRPTKVS